MKIELKKINDTNDFLIRNEVDYMVISEDELWDLMKQAQATYDAYLRNALSQYSEVGKE